MFEKSIRDHIEKQTGDKIISVQRVSGGSINKAAKIELQSEGFCFLKWNTGANSEMFECEVKGLKLLKNAGTDLVIPEIIVQGTLDRKTGYLVLELIPQGKGDSRSAAAFGRALAQLHKNENRRFGLDHDNYIGRLPQSNRWQDNWFDFFVQERMNPQLKMAIDSDRFSSSMKVKFESLYKELPAIFPDETPALLHGDLWGGNYFYNSAGNATIYDPAVYYGNREIEMAFTHLFGGFSQDFYDAYNESYPLNPNFNSRMELYNLYPLMVHTNMFGGHYGQQVKSIVNRYV